MRPFAKKTNRVSLKILTPRGQVEKKESITPVPPLLSLNGKKIGVLINTQDDKHDRFVFSLEEVLKRKFLDIEFRTWRIPYGLSSHLKKPILEQIATHSDALIALMGDSGSATAKTMVDLVSIEQRAKPSVFLVLKYFEVTARVNARNIGLLDPRLVVLQMPMLTSDKETEDLEVEECVIDGVVSSLTQGLLSPREAGETVKRELVFHGRNHLEAIDNMEKYFLQHSWSDGFPLKPPTKETVRQMIEGVDLPPDYVIGIMMPGGTEATVEKIAVNAVMAGCLSQHMPVLVAAVEAIVDPKFDLLGIQCTAGMVSPLLIVSGRNLIEQLNINYSYSTLGPGWQANSTIGRALRLIMINIGHAWPGNPDMKAIGSPFKYVMLMAENEKAYEGAWEPIRMAEGFSHDQPTLSVMPAVTWQVRFIPSDLAKTHHLVSFLGKLAKEKNDNVAGNWGLDNLILLNWTAFDIIRREGYSRTEIQEMIYQEAQVPCREFFRGKEPSADAGTIRIPDEILERCKTDPKAMLPLLRTIENIKMVVAGAEGYGTAMVVYVSTWGYGPANFVTKPIKLPRNWANILEKNKGWKTPILT